MKSKQNSPRLTTLENAETLMQAVDIIDPDIDLLESIADLIQGGRNALKRWSEHGIEIPKEYYERLDSLTAKITEIDPREDKKPKPPVPQNEKNTELAKRIVRDYAIPK